jgi:hypothetical protein
MSALAERGAAVLPQPIIRESGLSARGTNGDLLEGETDSFKLDEFSGLLSD